MKVSFLITFFLISFFSFSQNIKITYEDKEELTLSVNGIETDYFIQNSELVSFEKFIVVDDKKLFLNKQILLKCFKGNKIIILNVYISKDGSKLEYEINNLTTT